MIIRINTRANGEQLADYLVTLKDNEHIEILEVDGREHSDAAYLKQTILGMELNAKLTKCKNPFLNVQINPAYGEDKQMTREDWGLAADLLAQELGYQGQRRVIVLHTKKGRTHAHVVFERYQHDTQTVIPTKNSRLNAKFARAKIEKALGHKRTAWRNKKTPEIKEVLTSIWNKTAIAEDFIKQARAAGFIVASGTGNRPFMVVDRDGVSYDLVRQLNGIRTKEVRARLRNEHLMTDKQAIEFVRNEQPTGSGKKEDGKNIAKPIQHEFAENSIQAVKSVQELRKERLGLFNGFVGQGEEIIADTREPEPPSRKEAIAINFAENKSDIKNIEELEREELKEKIRKAQEAIKAKQKKGFSR